MSKLEVLCVAMHQKDFSLVEKLNLKCDAIIANQADFFEYAEENYQWGKVKLVSTKTRGVGNNRNVAFIHASGDILLLSDDDMKYTDTYVDDILKEFEKFPKADVIIFNIDTNDEKRKQKQNLKCKKITRFSRLPYGAPRIAIKRSSWEKSNIWFTTLFGGGAKYSNGEDSIFLKEIQRKKLNIYVSNVNIGMVDMSDSTWFKGANEEFFFNKGAYIKRMYSLWGFIYKIYFAFRVKTKLSIKERLFWLNKGSKAYKNNISFKDEERN